MYIILNIYRYHCKIKKILWNNTYSLGQYSWIVKLLLVRGGRNIVGNWFEALQWKTIHYFFKCSWGRKFVGKGDPRNPRSSILHEKQ